jgi:hypothetical protein
MRVLTHTTDPYDVMGVYGRPGTMRQGVLVDHLHLVDESKVRTLTSTTWVVTDDGKGWPVLCGYLIPIVTEDGPSDGRCGVPIDKDSGFCTNHAAERDEWLAMSELEKAHWEREQERMFG